MKSLFPPLERYGDRLAFFESRETVAGGFSGALVWKILRAGQAYAVRGWPPETDPRRVRALHGLLSHVAGQGVPVAVPLADVRGLTLFLHDGRWWQVEPWLPGRADFREAPTAEKLTAAMRTLAAFHHAATTFRPSDDDVQWFGGPAFGPAPAVLDRARLLPLRLGGSEREIMKTEALYDDGEFGELARRALRVFDRSGVEISEQVNYATSISVPLGPCLRDVWHDHVLFTGDEVTGLVDPAACRCDTVASDLSRLLGSLLHDDTLLWETAIAEYARHRPLSIDEIALIPILDRSGLVLSAATWIRQRYLFGQRHLTPAIIARLRDMVVRLERIA